MFRPPDIRQFSPIIFAHDAPAYTWALGRSPGAWSYFLGKVVEGPIRIRV